MAIQLRRPTRAKTVQERREDELTDLIRSQSRDDRNEVWPQRIKRPQTFSRRPRRQAK